MKQRLRSFAEESLSPSTFLFWLCLAPIGILYGLLQRLRVSLYRRNIFTSYRASQPVISIGNLTVGGTGKTPIVDLVARCCLQCGERPAIISRGYGGKIRSGVAIVSYGDGRGPLLSADVCGDEPFLLAKRNPQTVVIVAPRRRQGIETAIHNCHATLIILDDGFQHLAVQRDLDILLLDARRPFGNGSLLPAGLLREPPAAHSRAHLCILTRDDTLDTPTPFPDLLTLHCRHQLAAEFVAIDGTVRQSKELRNLLGVAFAGIAVPESFFRSLKEMGLQLSATFALNDHADFDQETLNQLKQAAISADFFVTTEKDGVKLHPSDFSLPCYQALLELEFSPTGHLEQSIISFISRMRTP